MARKRVSKSKPQPQDGLRRGLKCSILLHAVLLAILAGHLPSCGRGNSKEEQQSKAESQSGSDKHIKPKLPDEVQVELVNVPKQPPVPSYQVMAHQNEDCKDFFGGIGIEFSQDAWPNWVVAAAPAGYPAAKAGIVPGTKIINGSHIRGEVGTMVDVIIEAEDGSRSTLSLIRDKICLGKIYGGHIP